MNYIYKKIINEDDINNRRNEWAKGNYPLGMSDCEVVGINGDCGIYCPVYQNGLCKEPNPDWELE
jgi:hypothetical protein